MIKQALFAFAATTLVASCGSRTAEPAAQAPLAQPQLPPVTYADVPMATDAGVPRDGGAARDGGSGPAMSDGGASPKAPGGKNQNPTPSPTPSPMPPPGSPGPTNPAPAPSPGH
jgi:hypothetical protein